MEENEREKEREIERDREFGVLEEGVCDPRHWVWHPSLRNMPTTNTHTHTHTHRPSSDFA